MEQPTQRPTQIYTKKPSQIVFYEPRHQEFRVESVELFVRPESGEKAVFNFEQEQITIGAASDNDLVLSDPFASRYHALIEKEDHGKYRLKDLESRNGTWVKGHQIRSTVFEMNGEFLIGTTLITYKLTLVIEKMRPYRENRMGEMLGRSRQMKEIFGMLRRVAPTDTTVCLQGESGTGKELAARQIHLLSLNPKAPFVAINCGAIPANLIESEFFGHERGAFTGAQDRRIGAFEQAHGGTLFLDEIGEMPLDLQTRLLRVLENKSFRRIGGDQEIPVKVRIVAATHQSLDRLVMQKKFREDLYYRLFVLPIVIPPLRERPEDIPLIVEQFLREAAKTGPSKRLTEKAMSSLTSHPWRGNVRELKNCLQRVLLFSDDVIEQYLVENVLADSIPMQEDGERVSRQEREAILRTIRECQGNFTAAAKKLGISRTTLHAKLKAYNMNRQMFDTKGIKLPH